jgi:RNA polymerase sigma-70 factor (ECF subfamily)
LSYIACTQTLAPAAERHERSRLVIAECSVSPELSHSSHLSRGSFGRLPALGRGIQNHLGLQLRLADEGKGPWPMPELILILATRLDHLLTVQDRAQLSEFQDGILEARPGLRRFALSLANNPDRADDLVQDTILRALNKRSYFQPGTNLSAWLFTILRNSFFSEHRKRVHEVADSDGDHAARLTVAPAQMDKLNLQDLQDALMKIDPDQRKALLLVSAQGLSYEEAAIACRTPVGTIKSRVNRARIRLADLMGYREDDPLPRPSARRLS